MNSSVVVPLGLLTIVAVYYLVVWYRVGRDPKPGVVVPRYDPPRRMSAAMLRYCWVQRFDERVLLCGILSLVTRGLVRLESSEPNQKVRVVWPPKKDTALPEEEAVLFRGLCSPAGRKGVPLTLLDDHLATMAAKMYASISNVASRHYFAQNRREVLVGLAISCAAILAFASPRSIEQCVTILVSLAVILLAVGYLYFLTQRVVELARVDSRRVRMNLSKRLLTSLLLSFSCVAGIVLGSVTLGGVFGPGLIGLLMGMIGLNLLFLHLMKAPTREGRQLLDEIEGFREFLRRVEHLPMDRPDEPNAKAAMYEKYLPYALALDVEQEWCDQFAALTSSAHEYLDLQSTHAIYLGMWDGRPVEVAYRARTGNK